MNFGHDSHTSYIIMQFKLPEQLYGLSDPLTNVNTPILFKT